MVINSCDTYDSYLGELRFENLRKSKTKIRQIFSSYDIGHQGNLTNKKDVNPLFPFMTPPGTKFSKVLLPRVKYD